MSNTNRKYAIIASCIYLDKPLKFIKRKHIKVSM